MSTVSDARVVRTREALRQAMIELAGESPLEAITVRAIAARAGVGYATFFRHYPDKDALLAEVTELLIREFLLQVRPLLQRHDRAAAARTLCQYVLDNLAIHKALYAGGAGDTVRAEMLRQSLSVFTKTPKFTPRGPLDDLLLFHFVSAILNLIAWWLRNLDKIEADTMAEIIERTVLTPVSALRRQPPRAPAEAGT